MISLSVVKGGFDFVHTYDYNTHYCCLVHIIICFGNIVIIRIVLEHIWFTTPTRLDRFSICVISPFIIKIGWFWTIWCWLIGFFFNLLLLNPLFMFLKGCGLKPFYIWLYLSCLISFHVLGLPFHYLYWSYQILSFLMVFSKVLGSSNYLLSL